MNPLFFSPQTLLLLWEFREYVWRSCFLSPGGIQRADPWSSWKWRSGGSLRPKPDIRCRSYLLSVTYSMYGLPGSPDEEERIVLVSRGHRMPYWYRNPDFPRTGALEWAHLCGASACTESKEMHAFVQVCTAKYFLQTSLFALLLNGDVVYPKSTLVSRLECESGV